MRLIGEKEGTIEPLAKGIKTKCNKSLAKTHGGKRKKRKASREPRLRACGNASTGLRRGLKPSSLKNDYERLMEGKKNEKSTLGSRLLNDSLIHLQGGRENLGGRRRSKKVRQIPRPTS